VLRLSVEQHSGGINAFGPTSFVSEFGADLLPTSAFLSDQRVGTKFDIVKEYFCEMFVPGQIVDGECRYVGTRETSSVNS